MNSFMDIIAFGDPLMIPPSEPEPPSKVNFHTGLAMLFLMNGEPWAHEALAEIDKIGVEETWKKASGEENWQLKTKPEDIKRYADMLLSKKDADIV